MIEGPECVFLFRGSDNNGNVANFAESEEIVVHRSKNDSGKINLLSFLQLRGSVPLLWTQMPNLELNPRIVPRDDYSANSFAFKKHCTELTNTYGKTVLINLIDKKGTQKGLGDYYQALAKEFKENKGKHLIYLIYSKY